MFKRNLMLVDGINLILAVALVLSPWILALPAGLVSYSAIAAGVVIGVVAVLAMLDRAPWEEWVNLLLGVWVLASPFVLGFATIAAAMWVHVGIGLAVAVVAAAELLMMSRSPPAPMVTG